MAEWFTFSLAFFTSLVLFQFSVYKLRKSLIIGSGHYSIVNMRNMTLKKLKMGKPDMYAGLWLRKYAKEQTILKIY